MILEEKIAKVGIQGFHKPIKLSMEANSVGFRIIIKNIYSDPIKAIVRELGTNALESHIKAGNVETPFSVTVPTSDKPEFIIRDYGTGISYEDLRHIYAVMFRSDKRDSNEYNGCFGIGSKSPYAYSDNFNMESYVDGRKYIYTCFIDQDGMPNIAPVFDEDGIPTDEPNGVKITIPVANKDIYQFQNAAKEIYSYFRYKPTININLSEIKYDDLPYDTWKVRSGTPRNCNVVMGDVAYKVTVYDKVGKYKSLLNEPIDIIAEIGDVSVDSGRERIVADTKSINFIMGRLETIVKDCNEYVENQISSAKTEWELRKRAIGLKRSFMSSYASKLTWNGVVYNLTELTTSVGGPKDATIKEFSDGTYTKVKRLYPSDKQIVFIDKCVASHLRCLHWSAKNNKEIIGFICERDKFDEFVAEHGITDYLIASNLERPPVEKRDYDRYKSIVKYKSSFYYRGRYADYWESETPEIEDGGYYVVVDRGSFMVDSQRNAPEKLKAIIDSYGSVTVYGIPKSLEKEFIDNPDWHNICEVAKEKMVNKWSAINGAESLYFYNKFIIEHSYSKPFMYLARNHISGLTNQTVKSMMGRALKFNTVEASKMSEEYREVFGTDVELELNDNKKNEIDGLIKEIGDFISSKPLLGYLPNPEYQPATFKTALLSYLNG